MNLDKFGNYFRDKKIIWLLLPLAVLLTLIVYSNGSDVEADIDNKIPEIPLARNDSASIDKFAGQVASSDSGLIKNNLKVIDSATNALKFPKDSVRNTGTIVNSNTLKEDIETKSAPNTRSSRIAEDIYQDDYSDKSRLAELEAIKREKKQERIAFLLEKLNKEKEEKKQKEAEKKPKKLINGEIVSTVDYENTSPGSNRFHTLYSTEREKIVDSKVAEELSNFRGMIHANQEILNGGRVQIRLLESLVVKGKTIPKGTIVYGIASFGNERVSINVSSIFYQETIFPIKLDVFDMDGMSGIFVPNIVEVQAIKEATGTALSGVNVPISSGDSFGKNLGAVAANTAGQSGKQYLNAKVRTQKAYLKSNYFIYLK